MALFANETRILFSDLGCFFFGACSLQNEVVDPRFSVFLARVDHFLSAWQV